MNNESKNGIVEIIGGNNFERLSREFDRETQLQDIPDEILALISSVDVTTRDYANDRNAVVSIAFITFAYKMADKVQHAKYGSNDILLLKVLAKNEVSRRKGKAISENELWDAPVYDLITGEVGEKIRETRFMTNPA
jgi:hypothetical protein